MKLMKGFFFSHSSSVLTVTCRKLFLFGSLRRPPINSPDISVETRSSTLSYDKNVHNVFCALYTSQKWSPGRLIFPSLPPSVVFSWWWSDRDFFIYQSFLSWEFFHTSAQDEEMHRIFSVLGLVFFIDNWVIMSTTSWLRTALYIHCVS